MSFLPPSGGADDRRRRSARGPSDDEDARDTGDGQDEAPGHDATGRDESQPADASGSDATELIAPAESRVSRARERRQERDRPSRERRQQRDGTRPERTWPDSARQGRDADDFDAIFPGAEYPSSRVERRRAVQAASTPETGVGKAVGVTALSVVPGLGLSLTRRRKLGIALLVLLVIGLGLLTWYLLRNDALSRNGAMSMALDWIAQPRRLRFLWIALIVGGLIWVASVILTAVSARPERMTGVQRGTLAGFTAVMCILVAVPVVRALQYIDTTEATASEVFAPSSSGDDDDGGPGRPSTPNLDSADPWEHVDRVNMLLIGSDSGDGREGVRPDSMIVVSVDTETGDAVMIGIPRNLQNVPIPADLPLSQQYPDGFDCGPECMVNGIWTAAVEHSEQEPDLYADDDNPGLTATRESVAAVIGQPVHYTVLANLDGFSDLVDAMGGVTINVQERLPMGGQMQDIDGGIQMIPGTESGWLETGEQELGGYETLWYARSRVTSDDFSRMRRQRCVVAAIVDQVDPGTMLTRFQDIMGAAGDNIRVSIPRDELGAWVTLVERVQDGSIRSQPLTPQNVNVGAPDYNEIHVMVAEALEPPEEDDSAPEETEDPTTEATSDPTTEEADPETPPVDEVIEADPAEEVDGSDETDDLMDVDQVC